MTDADSDVRAEPGTIDIVRDPPAARARVTNDLPLPVADAAPEPAPTANTGPLRPIWLCADDYGMSHGVNAAIRDLVVRGRLNAVSVMVAGPALSRSEARSLSILNSGTRRMAFGLHLTLTAPFRPLVQNYSPTQDGRFLSLKDTFRAAFLRKLKEEKLAVEVAAQMKAFIAAIGRAPDFVDGHQHVHLLPQIRNAVVMVVKQEAPTAWIRQCGRMGAGMRRFTDRKGLVLDVLSRKMRKTAAKAGLRTNAAFAGTYSFDANADFARLFPAFVRNMPADGLVMCHPGYVDSELQQLDTLTDLREKEHAFLGSDAFPETLRTAGVTLE
jgi:predicted glycoside hydrolase/deacetylase ChbG (UPF0249 family)